MPKDTLKTPRKSAARASFRGVFMFHNHTYLPVMQPTLFLSSSLFSRHSCSVIISVLSSFLLCRHFCSVIISAWLHVQNLLRLCSSPAVLLQFPGLLLGPMVHDDTGGIHKHHVEFLVTCIIEGMLHSRRDKDTVPILYRSLFSAYFGHAISL